MGASTDATPFATRVAMTASATTEYLRLLVVPWPPAPHRFPDTASALAGVLLVVTLLLVAALAWRRWWLGMFLCCWFALTLLPATPLVPGRTPQVAERFLYVPSVAFAWLGGWAMASARARLAGRAPGLRRSAAVAAIAVGLGALALTAIRVEDWRDERHLFTRMAQSEPRSALAHLNLGYVSDRAGDLARADGEFRTALALRPDWAPAWLGLALVESRRGAHDAAIAHAERARALDGRGEFVHAQLGAIYGIAGRFEDAAASSREAIHRNPRRLSPYVNLVFALADAGRLTEAREALSEAERVAAGQISPDAGALRTFADLRRRLGVEGPTPLAREASR
jgi:tetratricopeptide (TPR) repeat protein